MSKSEDINGAYHLAYDSARKELETFRKRRNFVEYPESVGQLVTPERLEFSLLHAGDVLKIVSQTVA